MFYELPSRGRGEARATRSAGACAACRAIPRDRGIGSEAYLNSTSQGPTPEDARKDGHIHGRSRRIREISGLMGVVIYILVSVCPAWGQDATHFLNLGLEVGGAMMLGGLILGVILGLLAYMITHHVAKVTGQSQ